MNFLFEARPVMTFRILDSVMKAIDLGNMC